MSDSQPEITLQEAIAKVKSAYERNWYTNRIGVSTNTVTLYSGERVALKIFMFFNFCIAPSIILALMLSGGELSLIIRSIAIGVTISLFIAGVSLAGSMGQTVLRVDLQNGLIIREDVKALFKRFNKTTSIPFKEINTVALEEVWDVDHGGLISHYLCLYTRSAQRIVLLSFKNEYPENILAPYVKDLIAVASRTKL